MRPGFSGHDSARRRRSGQGGASPVRPRSGAAGPLARPLLALLGQYFPGYEVTWSGTGLGLAYGFVTGFAGGWSFAFLRNACLFVWVALLRGRANFELLRRFLEFI